MSENKTAEEYLKEIHALVARGDHGLIKTNAECTISAIITMQMDKSELSNENDRLEQELEKTNNKLLNYENIWEEACLHVAHALELLGVDTSVESGEVPDTWTLVKHCEIIAAKLKNKQS